MEEESKKKSNKDRNKYKGKPTKLPRGVNRKKEMIAENYRNNRSESENSISNNVKARHANKEKINYKEPSIRGVPKVFDGRKQRKLKAQT